MAVPFLGGASDLLTIVKSLTAAGSAGVDQDWAMLSANLATAVGKAGVYASKMSKPFSDIVKDKDNLILGSPTAILDLAGLAILLIDMTGGFGAAETGDSVPEATAMFTDYAEKLAGNCTPDPRDWSGDAATAYTNQLNALIDFTASMKEFDAEWQTYLAMQGDAVRSAHLCIATSFGILTGATGVALGLYLIKPPPWGKIASMTFQVGVALSVLATVIAFELRTLSFSSMNLQDATALAAKYQALGQEIERKMAGTYGQIGGGTEAKKTSSSASDFQNISDGISPYPDVSSLAAAATAAGDNPSSSQKVLLDAAAEQEAAAYTTTDETQETIDETEATPDGAQPQTPAPAAVAAPSTPAFTPPSPAQALKASVVAAAVTQSFSQNVAQPVSQRVQQVTQMAQSQQGAGPAAEDAPAGPPADDAAAAGASAGTEGVQRAPIDVPAGGTEDAAAGRGQVL